MKWSLKQGNIIDEPADVLICSANSELDLSSGVGADLLSRYGPAMQNALHDLVAARTPRYIRRGEVIPYSDDVIPYKAILHAVAVDGFYDSNSEVIENTVKLALQLAAFHQAKKVALTALATGLGHLTLPAFADGIRPLLSQDFPPVEEVCICLMEDERVRELAGHLPEATVIS